MVQFSRCLLYEETGRPNFGDQALPALNRACLEIYVPKSDLELKLKWELPPSGWQRVGDARKKAIDQMVSAIGNIVESVWAEELPGILMQKARRRVGIGVREAVAILTLQGTQPQAEDYWGSNWYLASIPAYWEPAESCVDTHELSEHQLQAYRWSAAIVNLHVRNSLEDLHAAHTRDESMPALNRSIRNAVYGILLEDIWLGHYLAYWPHCLLVAKADGAPVMIPNAAGAFVAASD